MHKSETNMSLESVISDTDSLLIPDPVTQPPFADSKDPTGDNEETRNNGNPYMKYKRRTEFFLNHIFFVVGNKLYSIPEIMFPGAGYLKSATNLSSGKSEDEPMELDVTVSEMDSLMSVLLDRYVELLISLTTYLLRPMEHWHTLILCYRRINAPLDLPIEKWSQALGLATLWKIDAARNFIIDHITGHFPGNLAHQIKLADDYDVGKWLHPAYETICKRDTPPTEEEVTALGPRRLVAIYKIREACRKPKEKDYLRFQCSGCSTIWLFDGTNPPSSNLKGPCHTGYNLRRLPAGPANNSTTTESVEQLIKASTELAVTPGGNGRAGGRSRKTEKDSEGISDADECEHEFIWRPTKGNKKGKGGGVVCIKICLKCGISK